MKIIRSVGMWAVTVSVAAVVACGIFCVWMLSAWAVMIEDIKR